MARLHDRLHHAGRTQSILIRARRYRREERSDFIFHQQGVSEMRTSSRDWSKRYCGLSLGLVAAACLWPAVAGAQPPDPTDSDSHNNTAAGTDALLNVTGYNNTAAGYVALTATTTGAYNTAAGAFALSVNTIGSFNAAGGAYALSANTTGHNNTATGAYALRHNTSGSYNSASGDSALYDNNAGSNNTASGGAALYANTIGANNTAAGYDALYSNGTGSNNTALGYEALKASTRSNKNVAIGAGALSALTTGGGNIALGASAGSATTTGTHNIYVGNPGLAGTESNAIRIGDVQTRTFIAGIADAPMSGATVVIKSNGRLGVVASSARYKQDIKPLDDMAGKLAQLRPVSYRYKAEPDATHYGLIAEEVDAVMPELVVRDGKNRPESVQYLELIPLLLQQWKAQQAEIERAHALIAQQQTELAALRRTLDTRLAARAVLR
jgi:hypothetical protein